MSTALQRAFANVRITPKTNQQLALRVLDRMEAKVKADNRRAAARAKRKAEAVRATPQQ